MLLIATVEQGALAQRLRGLVEAAADRRDDLIDDADQVRPSLKRTASARHAGALDIGRIRGVDQC